MKAELKDGKLNLTGIELDEEPSPSNTGKMLIYQYIKWDDLKGIIHAGHQLRATVTVGIKNPDYVGGKGSIAGNYSVAPGAAKHVA